jgi:hypothetical protein
VTIGLIASGEAGWPAVYCNPTGAERETFAARGFAVEERRASPSALISTLCTGSQLTLLDMRPAWPAAELSISREPSTSVLDLKFAYIAWVMRWSELQIQKHTRIKKLLVWL